MPGVVGHTLAQARSELSAAGLRVTVVRQSNEASKGTVFAQSPEAGAEVGSGSAVVIAVSRGPSQVMANVLGESADEAERFLEEEFGLDVSQEEEKEPCAQPPGTECRQDPEPGERIQEKDLVILFVRGG